MTFLNENGKGTQGSFRRVAAFLFVLLICVVSILYLVLAAKYKFVVDFKAFCVMLGVPLIAVLFLGGAITITDIKEILYEVENKGKIDPSVIRPAEKTGPAVKKLTTTENTKETTAVTESGV